jgi:predicted protein tyrosine phosphatase
MKLVVGPLAAVQALMAAHRPDRLISLLAPGQAMPTVADRPHLRLELNDLTAPRTGLVAPSGAAVAELLAFGMEPPCAAVLLHCWFGISRSPAAAYILACAATPPGQEAALAARLRAASPECTPNARLIALADARLRRGGRMMAAIAKIGRGRESDCGRPFVLEV